MCTVESRYLMNQPASCYTVMYSCIALGLVILLSGDVEPNPGPARFPCGECGKACTSYRGAKASILCDTCGIWYHGDCVNMSDTIFSILGSSDLPWECHNCGLPNVSSSLFDTSVDSISANSSLSSHHNDASPESPPQPPNNRSPRASIRTLV